MEKVLESMNLTCFWGKDYREECLWNGGGGRRMWSVQSLGGKKLSLTSKDRPANWNGETLSGCALYQDFLSFSWQIYILKNQGYRPQWTTYCERWAGLLAEVTWGRLYAPDWQAIHSFLQDMRSSKSESSLYPLRVLITTGPFHQAHNFVWDVVLCENGIFVPSSIFHWLALISVNAISPWYHD